MMMTQSPEAIFSQYKKGVAYKQSIDLYDTVKKNQNFYVGNQWEGVNAPELDKPVFNILKRVCNMFIASIVSDDIGASVRPFRTDAQSQLAAKLLEKEIARAMEHAKVKTKNRDAMKNACVDGDCCFYVYFDEQAKTGQLAQGRLAVDLIDNTNVLFSNTATTEVQKQDYILIVQRRHVDDVRREAAANGIAQAQIDAIVPDADENALTAHEEEQNVTVLVKLWRENGTIHCAKSTQTAFVKYPFDTKLTLYPVAYMSWEKVKNRCHGQAAVTELVPNQIFINKCYAMGMDYVKKMAFPKLIYDGNKFPNGFSNRIGEAIKVSGNVNDAITNAFKMPEMSYQVMELVEKTMAYTKEYMGASDASLGTMRPDNATAIIALQKATTAPLELNKLAFYQFVEDYIRIFIDIITTCYGLREVSYTAPDGAQVQTSFDFALLKDLMFDLEVNIGASAYWSEITQVQTADNLFNKGVIADPEVYLESIPETYVKNKQSILNAIRESKNAAQAKTTQAQ